MSECELYSQEKLPVENREKERLEEISRAYAKALAIVRGTGTSTTMGSEIAAALLVPTVLTYAIFDLGQLVRFNEELKLTEFD